MVDEQRQNPDVAKALADQRRRARAIERRLRYYDGTHDTVVPDSGTVSNPDLRDLLLSLADNMCDDVVDETVDRLEVVAWTSTSVDDSVGPDAATDPAGGEPVEDDPLGEAAMAVWTANRMPARERSTYRDGLAAADGWAMVERGADGVWRTFPQRPEQMGCRYRDDQPDVIDVAWKVWRDGQRWRLNLYYGADTSDPGGARLERWTTKGSRNDGGIPEARAFIPLNDDEDAENVRQGPRPDWDRCPVFHYPQGEVGGYGRSVLTDVIPLQDVLNLSLSNLVVNSEDVALPARYATGVQVPTDPVTGEQRPLRRGPAKRGDMLTSASTEARFGQFAAADLTQHIAILEGLRVEIARKGYLPASSVNVSAAATAGASGLSMLVQEGRQVKRCKTLQRDWGWVHAELVAFMLRRQGGPFAGVQAADIEPEWATPATRDEQAMWELASVKVSLGVPRERVLVECGYSPDEARRWVEAAAAARGGRVSEGGGMPAGIGAAAVPAGGIASITQPGVPGGMAVGGLPVQPAGAAAPGVPGAGAL